MHVLASGATALQLWDRIFDSYALFTAFEQLGSSEAALQMAREHSLNRYAFGRPIGSFQAIKHMLADMLVAIDLARSNCYFGAASLSMERDALRESSAVARISATDAFRQCARGSIQVHGALGVTWESNCHLYYRRAQALAASPGSLRFWKERLDRTAEAPPPLRPSPRPSPASGRASGLPPPAGRGVGSGDRVNYTDLPDEAQFRLAARSWINAERAVAPARSSRAPALCRPPVRARA